MEKAEYFRFFDLTMKRTAGQLCDAEIAELDEILKTDEQLRHEYRQLGRETRFLTHLMPLIYAVRANGKTLPASAREQLRSELGKLDK